MLWVHFLQNKTLWLNGFCSTIASSNISWISTHTLCLTAYHMQGLEAVPVSIHHTHIHTQGHTLPRWNLHRHGEMQTAIKFTLDGNWTHILNAVRWQWCSLQHHLTDKHECLSVVLLSAAPTGRGWNFQLHDKCRRKWDNLFHPLDFRSLTCFLNCFILFFLILVTPATTVLGDVTARRSQVRRLSSDMHAHVHP